MNCPKCDTKRGKIIVTQPADRRDDGRCARHRKCLVCNHSFHTLEIVVSEVRQMEQQALSHASTASYSGPLPSHPTGPLVDIEHELEELLQPSLTTLLNTLQDPAEPNKVKVDTARWLVADRREYRKALAEAANASDTPAEDPSIRELARVLSLVPQQLEGTS